MGQISQRNCGPCTMCCTTMAVVDMTPPKPDNCRCEHQRKEGCSIYKRRPETCRQFECLWLMDGGRSMPGELRPDKVKAIVVPTDQGGIVVHVRPEHEGAHHKGPLFNWLSRVAERIPVVIACGAKRTLVGTKAIEQMNGGAGLVQLQPRR